MRCRYFGAKAALVLIWKDMEGYDIPCLRIPRTGMLLVYPILAESGEFWAARWVWKTGSMRIWALSTSFHHEDRRWEWTVFIIVEGTSAGNSCLAVILLGRNSYSWCCASQHSGQTAGGIIVKIIRRHSGGYRFPWNNSIRSRWQMHRWRRPRHYVVADSLFAPEIICRLRLKSNTWLATRKTEVYKAVVRFGAQVMPVLSAEMLNCHRYAWGTDEILHGNLTTSDVANNDLGRLLSMI